MREVKWASLFFGYITMAYLSIGVLIDVVSSAYGAVNKIGMILLTCAWASLLALGFMLLVHAKQEDNG